LSPRPNLRLYRDFGKSSSHPAKLNFGALPMRSQSLQVNVAIQKRRFRAHRHQTGGHAMELRTKL